MPGRDAVVCGAHGETRVTFTCVHVADGIACGFHTAADTNAAYPDAWCDACEAVPTVDVVPLCTFCYDAARARNQAALRSSWDALLTAARAHGDALQASIAGYARWHFDGDARTLRLGDPDRVPMIARVRMVGSYSSDTRTFQWSWATYGERDPIVGDVRFLRALGQVRDFAPLREANRPARPDDGWDLARVAALVLGAQAIFRMPADHLRWWMLLDDLHVET